MRRNTAEKWGKAMLVTPWVLISAQLRYEDAQGTTYADPYGVLAHFLDPDGWALAWDGMSYLWHGEQFKLPPDWLRRPQSKIRQDGVLMHSEIGAPVWPLNLTWQSAAEWVRANHTIL